MSTGTLPPGPFVPYAYQVSPTRTAAGSGKFAAYTGLAKVSLLDGMPISRGGAGAAPATAREITRPASTRRVAAR